MAAPAPPSTTVTAVTLPQPDPFNVQAVKRYVFNETGNIMMATTDTTSDTIQQSVREVFAEVSVFFAAMTKAISQTRNPYGVPVNGVLPFYSLYNYDALEAVIDGSGYFVHVNEEDVSYTTSSWGANFSQELIEAVLGLATGTGALAFASAMVASMGKEGLNISGQSSSSTSQVANIVFVCEYLLGMPVVSALVVTADASTVAQTFSAGPCFKEQSSSTTMTVHKDTYMFVTPTFIKQYANDLNSGMYDPAYLNLIMNLQSLVERTPAIAALYSVPAPGQEPVPVSAPGPLKPGATYALYGQYLGETKGTLALVPSPPSGLSVTFSEWGDSGITFSVANSNAAPAPSLAIQVTTPGGTVLTTGQYTIAGTPTPPPPPPPPPAAPLA
jgi:hypothetical protein